MQDSYKICKVLHAIFTGKSFLDQGYKIIKYQKYYAMHIELT